LYPLALSGSVTDDAASEPEPDASPGGEGYPGDADRGRVEVWVAIAGLFLLSASAAAYEIVPASVSPTVMADLGVTPTEAGWLVSVMYLVAVLTSVPVGAIMDRTGLLRAVTAAAGALLVAGVAGWAAAADGAYELLLASSVLGGLAYVTIWNAGATLAGRAVPRQVQATAVGVFTASAPAGFALGQFGGPLIADAAGWPAVFPAFAGVAVAGTVLFWWGSGRRSVGGDVETATPAQFRRVFADRTVWLVCGMGFVAFSLYLFLNSWLPAFFEDRLGLSLAASGLLVALFPAVGIVARTGGGVLSDRWFGGRRRPVTLASFAVATPVVVGLAFVGGLWVAVALLAMAGAAIQLGIGLLFSYVREVVDPAVRATAVSLLTSVGLLGAFGAPIGAGWLIEQSGTYRPAFLAAGAVGVLGVALALATPEPAGRRDQ